MSSVFIPHLRASALALALLLAPTVLKAQNPQLSPADTALLKSVDTHYNRLRSLRTTFTESYDGLGMHKSEAGILLLSKPGRMRWSYTRPAGKVFVLNGKYAWSYSPGDAQAQRIAAKQMDDLRSPLRLLLGHAQLARELTGIQVTAVSDGSIIRGTPRGQEARLRSLTLDVTPTGAIRSLKLEEVDGSVTEFHFSNLQENRSVTSADFVFTPPAGVPIVDGLPPI